MQIEYAPQFKAAFHNIVDCGQKYYSSKTVSNLYNSLKQKRDLLLDNPRMGQYEPSLEEYEEGYRYVVLYKYLKLIYYVQDESIYLVDIWDTRQSPMTLVSRIG